MANDSRFTYDIALERARKGAALLDEKVPGWRSRVHALKLDMKDCTLCVLGQLYGHYERGVFDLVNRGGLSYRVAAASTAHGFDFETDNLSEGTAAFELLNEAWREVLAS